MKVKSESEVAQSCLTLNDPMAAAYQAPPSMGFSRQEYWSGVPFRWRLPLNSQNSFPNLKYSQNKKTFPYIKEKIKNTTTDF